VSVIVVSRWYYNEEAMDGALRERMQQWRDYRGRYYQVKGGGEWALWGHNWSSDIHEPWLSLGGDA
jgi:hypothetical protein